MHESTSTRPNGEERMLALSGTEPEEGPEVELWTRLHRTRVQDFANSVERPRRAAQALAVAVHYGYVEVRSEEHTSELQSLMRISYAVFCLKKKKQNKQANHT